MPQITIATNQKRDFFQLKVRELDEDKKNVWTRSQDLKSTIKFQWWPKMFMEICVRLFPETGFMIFFKKIHLFFTTRQWR